MITKLKQDKDTGEISAVKKKRGRPSLTQHALEVMKNYVHADGSVGYDPILVLIELSLHAKSEKVKVEAAGLLLSRKAPALKSVEMSTSDGSSFALTIIHSNGQKSHIDNVSVHQNEPIETDGK